MFAVLPAQSGGAPNDLNPVTTALRQYGRTTTAYDHSHSRLLATDWADAADGAVLYGWIDNAAELAERLGREDLSDAALYAAAVERWGDEAERRIVGTYASALIGSDGTLRLARTPWSAPPLYWAQDRSGPMASPLLRVLFAAGAEKRLDYDWMVQQLGYGEDLPDTASAYRDVSRVPLGSIATVSRDGKARVHRWYDPRSLAPGSALDFDAQVEGARELLDRAARLANNPAGEQALALSGGIDSPIVADALLRTNSSDAHLRTITFGPHPDARVFEDMGNLADERERVRIFAAMHPGIEPHWADPDEAGFDYRARDMFEAMQLFAPGLANVGMYHGVYAKARDLGCDWLLTASLGNQSFSADGRWAYAEFARRGKWGEALALLRNRPGDRRSLPRKLLALSLLPNLPAGARSGLRAFAHPARSDMVSLLTPLNAAARSRIARSAWDDVHYGRDRHEATIQDYRHADGVGADVTLAFEELYGVRHRDVTAYRPLIEFCAGLPTEAFANNGEERHLAKALALGIMPEEQRADRQAGRHSADTHWRIGQRQEELIEQCGRMRDHAWLAEVLDIDRLQAHLAEWPEQPGFGIEKDWPRILALPRAILAAQFIAHVEGRNRL